MYMMENLSSFRHPFLRSFLNMTAKVFLLYLQSPDFTLTGVWHSLLPCRPLCSLRAQLGWDRSSSLPLLFCHPTADAEWPFTAPGSGDLCTPGDAPQKASAVEVQFMLIPCL